MGYMEKSAPAEDVLNAIRRAAKGQTSFTHEQQQRARQWCECRRSHWENLTVREKEVLRLLAQALSNREIAEHLQISEKTVEKYVSSVLASIGATSRVAAALWLLESGLEKS